MGKSQSYISKIERGEIEPSTRVFSLIIEELGFSDAEVMFTLKTLARFSE